MPILKFVQQHISDTWYESCGVFDVDNDGQLDIVCGAYWYPGPTFDRKCKIGDIQAIGEYFDDFSTMNSDEPCPSSFIIEQKVSFVYHPDEIASESYSFLLPDGVNLWYNLSG